MSVFYTYTYVYFVGITVFTDYEDMGSNVSCINELLRIFSLLINVYHNIDYM